MHCLVHQRLFNRTLRLDLLLNGCHCDISEAVPKVAKIDTGCILGQAGACEVGLVLPLSYKDLNKGALFACRGIGLIEYRIANSKAKYPAQLFLVDVQVVGDGGQLWPETPLFVDAVFLDRDEPPLIGSGLWRLWRMEIDGPAKRFSIWVP